MANETTYLDLWANIEDRPEKTHLLTINTSGFSEYPLVFLNREDGENKSQIFTIEEVDKIIQALIQFRIDWENNNAS